jgi:hypothetical protein
MTDGPGSVSTLILVVGRDTAGGRIPENNGLSEFGGVAEWVGDKDEGDDENVIKKVEDEGTADARAATMRVRTAEVHMNA